VLRRQRAQHQAPARCRQSVPRWSNRITKRLKGSRSGRAKWAGQKGGTLCGQPLGAGGGVDSRIASPALHRARRWRHRSLSRKWGIRLRRQLVRVTAATVVSVCVGEPTWSQHGNEPGHNEGLPKWDIFGVCPGHAGCAVRDLNPEPAD
jgi:hypothetical protein